MKTRSYTNYLDRVAGLIGVSSSDLQTDELTILNGFFNNAMKTAWQASNWLDLCPWGEARFAGNLLTYANNFANAAWTAADVTASAAQLANPADGRLTASKILEGSATASHTIRQAVTGMIPGQRYQYSVYLRPLGRTYIRIGYTDSTAVEAEYAVFNLSSGGSTSSTSATLGTINSYGITQANNGFYVCTLTFTTASTCSGSAIVNVVLQSDATTTSYAGNTSYGCYAWGACLIPVEVTSQTTYLIPWSQTGESEIEALFDLWQDQPASAPFPRRYGYELTPDGIQLISQPVSYQGNVLTNVTPPQPVYISYRKRMPDYFGSSYSASATYAVGDIILYTNTSTSVQNYYKCIVATSAGQSPQTTAASWELQEIPEFLFDYVVYRSWADWLKTEGQLGKAQIALQNAEEYLVNQFDRQERQMGAVLPTRYATHVTSQWRL